MPLLKFFLRFRQGIIQVQIFNSYKHKPSSRIKNQTVQIQKLKIFKIGFCLNKKIINNKIASLENNLWK